MIGGACILVVEDDAAINKVVCSYLGKLGAECVPAFSGTEGLMHLEGERRFDLLITDLMLPGAPGEEVVAAARARHVPIIVLSARTTEADKIEALDLGANDYITKPFSTGELLARVRAALRLNRFSSNPTGVFQAQDLLIQYERRKVYVGGEEIKLTQTEYNIVAFLSEHAGRVMTYPAIVRAIWGDTDCGSTKKLQVNMANIRRKLGSRPGHNNYIMNELGVGYRMIDADHDGPDAPADHEENA